ARRHRQRRQAGHRADQRRRGNGGVHRVSQGGRQVGMHGFKRRLAKYSRWLHIYVSMTSFVIVFFFAVTGWTLNHADRFSGRERLRKASGTVDTKWTGSGADAAKAEIADAIRRGSGVHG